MILYLGAIVLKDKEKEFNFLLPNQYNNIKNNLMNKNIINRENILNLLF